jgi:cytochrome c biogenesis protein CcdA
MWPFLILPVIAILSFIYGPKALNKYKRATDREEKNKQLIITIVLLSAGIISSIILLGVIITGIVLSNYRPWKLVDFRQENTLRSVDPQS